MTSMNIFLQSLKVTEKIGETSEWFGWIINGYIGAIVSGTHDSCIVYLGQRGLPRFAEASIHYHPLTSIDPEDPSYLEPSINDIKFFKLLAAYGIFKHYIVCDNGFYVYNNGREKLYNRYGKQVKRWKLKRQNILRNVYG